MQQVQQIIAYMAGDTGVAVSRIAAMLFLVVISVRDIRCRKVSVYALIGMGLCAGASCVWLFRDEILLHVAGVIVGLCFLFISWITREGLGYGDSLLIGIMGLYLGAFPLLEVLCGAWILTALAAGVLLARKNFQKNVSLPMIPFLTAGYMIMWISEIM